MGRKEKVFHLHQLPEQFALKLLFWANTHEVFTWLEGENKTPQYTSFDKLLAVGVVSELATDYPNAFQKLKHYVDSTQDYVFGYLGYDLKNDTENLKSENFDSLGFADLYFFQPQKLFIFKGNTVQILYHDSCIDEYDNDIKAIQNQLIEYKPFVSKVEIQQRVSPQEYEKQFNFIQQHLQRGDTYELNYCIEFFAENAVINPLEVYQKLHTKAQTPFSAFLKLKNKYILSASPERYLRKENQKIISQPIKGTHKRGNTPQDDEVIKEELAVNQKEISENIMVVDMVRNDLSVTASIGSVTVEELCGIYSFSTVHQMISTVSSQINQNVHAVDVLQTTFPMASMTGVPKISTMKLIEKAEQTKRGVYSGAIGYFTPNQNFDFNVVIRSILYNADNRYLSFSVGSALTVRSSVQNEYEECLLKVLHIKNILQN